MIQSTTLNSTAFQNPFTTNPGTIASANRMMIALMTIENNPNVKILMGSVRRLSIGLKNALRTPKTSATTMAIQ